MSEPVATGTLGRWDDEHVARLKELASKMSCSQIAAALWAEFRTAYSRSAVVGKLHRLGYSKPIVSDSDSRAGPRKPRKPRQPRTAHPCDSFDRRYLANWLAHYDGKFGAEVDPTPPRAKPNPDAAIPFNELTATSCRWPYGDGPFLFCGAEIAGGHPSYCRCHAEAASRPAPAMTASAMRWMGGRAA